MCVRAPPPLLLLLPLLLMMQHVAGSTVQVGSGARAQLAELLRSIPARGDPLDAMTEAQRHAWATDLRLTAGQTLEMLRSPRVAVAVDVKLVGFDGEGGGGLAVADHELQAHLRSLHNELETVALNPGPQRMLVTPEVVFRVHPAYYKLGHTINAAIAAELDSTQPSALFTASPLALIRPDRIVAAVHEDWQSSAAGGSSYTVYLLNPKASAPYAYAYDGELRSCPGGLYLSRDHPYAIYDITANVTFAGPGPGGKGQVLPHAVPVVGRYRPEVARHAVLPDLAALVWSAARHLVWPPLHHGDVSYSNTAVVAVIYMHQELVGERSYINRNTMQDELQDAVKGFQVLSVVEHWVPFGRCPACVAGLASALRVRTSLPQEARAQNQDGQRHNPGDPVAPRAVRYLDSASLGDWAAAWREGVLSLAGIDPEYHREHGGKLLPVFVFDTADTDPILIDGWRQAMALPSGDVVAVTSSATTVPSFFGCYQKQVHLDPRDLHRPIMAAVLQSGYGVADTGLHWSPATGRGWSFLWSLGPTPFGPLSAVPTLSFVQRDAVHRNAALAAINASVAHAVKLMEGVVRVAGPDAHVRSLLPPEQVIPYNQRISLLLHKLSAATAAMGRLDYHTALGFSLALSYDAAALHGILRSAKEGLSLELACTGTGGPKQWWLLPGGAAAACAVLIVWRALRGGGDAGSVVGGQSKSHLI